MDTVGQWGKALQAKGYTFVHFDGLNRFYISIEHKEIRRRFHLGVCWDDFRLSDTGRLVLNLHGRVEAEKLLVKCPSKYQGAEVEKSYPAAPGPAKS